MPVSLASVPGKIMEQIVLEIMLRHIENKKVIDDSQHGFTRGKWCLTKLEAFCDRVTALLDKETKTGVIYVDLRKAFDADLQNILVPKLKTKGFDRRTTWWIKNCLGGCTLRVAVRGFMSRWKSVISGIP